MVGFHCSWFLVFVFSATVFEVAGCDTVCFDMVGCLYGWGFLYFFSYTFGFFLLFLLIWLGFYLVGFLHFGCLIHLVFILGFGVFFKMLLFFNAVHCFYTVGCLFGWVLMRLVSNIVGFIIRFLLLSSWYFYGWCSILLVFKQLFFNTIGLVYYSWIVYMVAYLCLHFVMQLVFIPLVFHTVPFSYNWVFVWLGFYMFGFYTVVFYTVCFNTVGFLHSWFLHI